MTFLNSVVTIGANASGLEWMEFLGDAPTSIENGTFSREVVKTVTINGKEYELCTWRWKSKT